MLIFMILAFVFLFIFMIDAPKLIMDKHWKELIVYLALLALAFILTLLFSLDVRIPSPLKVIKFLIEDVFGLRYS